MKLSFWIFIIVAVLLVAFSVQNSGTTEINFLNWSINVSLAVIIIATFLIGLITGALYGYFSRKPIAVIPEKSNAPDEDFGTIKEDTFNDEEEK